MYQGSTANTNLDKRMSVDYGNKTIQPPLGTCYNPSDLWEIQMYKQLLEQNNPYCFPILKFHAPSHEGKKTKDLKMVTDLSTALFRQLTSGMQTF